LLIQQTAFLVFLAAAARTGIISAYFVRMCGFGPDNLAVHVIPTPFLPHKTAFFMQNVVCSGTLVADDKFHHPHPVRRASGLNVQDLEPCPADAGQGAEIRGRFTFGRVPGFEEIGKIAPDIS